MVCFAYFLLVLADSTNLHDKIFHYSQLTAAVLFPISFILAPSAICVHASVSTFHLQVPIDYIMCVLYPLHGHIGMSHIFSDYCGPVCHFVSRLIMQILSKTLRIITLFLSLFGMMGLLYLNATSDGLTATIKQLWRPKIQDKRD